MRSAVSAILSGTVPEQTMSYPDYQQTPHDHQTLLVVVRHIGRQLRTKQFNRAFDRISRVSQIKIQDPQNNSRVIWLRYLRSYPVENNDWGDFQTHRKALGLISIGQCNSQEELNELCRIHESLKVKYTWTLFDSRCVLFGLNSDGTIFEEQHSSEGSPSMETSDGHNLFSMGRLDSQNGDPHGGESPSTSMASSDLSMAGTGVGVPRPSCSSDTLPSMGMSHDEPSPHDDTTSEDSASRSESVTGTIQYATLENQERTSGTHCKPLHTPGNFKARTLFYPTMDMSQGLEADIDEFVTALFWVLESKRVDKLGLRKADRSLLLSALCAPFEKKDFVGLDLESKNNKKRADGRLKKQLGDLNLQAGLPGEAITHYQSAVEILKSVNDWLWLGGALEGVASASVAILYPQLRRSPTLQRNSSLQGLELVKMKHLAVNSANSLPPGLDPIVESVGTKAPIKNCLTHREIQEKYQEAVGHYGKYRQAGVIETEASIKAAMVLIEQKQILPAADFLQNAVFISLQLTEEEKMQRFNALSDMYGRLGFHRKAAFFKRVAAMRCVSPSNPQPNWNLCHSLLLQLLDGYNLSIDPNEPHKFGFYGWARLQIQVLQELVGTAKKKGSNALATRHMTLLIHTMLPHLSPGERGEFSMQLEMLSKDSEGVPTPIALENGMIVPPVHLSTIPLIKVFKLVQPTPHLRPEKIEVKSANEEISPFVYTPFVTNRNKDLPDNSKADFCWVEGEICEVNVILENPLPIELKLSSICLITEGVSFHVNSNVISIPAESTFPATLTGIPLGPGNLRILGYSTYTLGVKSNVRLKNIRAMKCPHIDVEIVAALPFLEVGTSKPKSEFFSSFSDSIVTSASVSLLMGESQECTISLTNTGKVPIENLELSIDSRVDKRISEIFRWSDENIQSQLPIQPGTSASFTVYIYGAGDFIGQPDFQACDTSSVSSIPIGNSGAVDGPSSLPSRLGAISERLRSSAKRTESSASRSSGKSGGSFSSFSGVTPKPSVSNYSKTYEAVMKLKYSGGPGRESGHFRICGVALNVEVAPALFITKWDTLPGESPSQFYLVLDIYNATQHEMELQYAGTKQILMEKLETCRIPIPVDKCSVADIEKGKEEVACYEHIVKNIDVKWILPDCSGKATLEGIRLSPEMVQLAAVSPIEWEITINGELAKTEEMHFEAGEMINVDVCLKNHMREELQDVRLSLAFYQDYLNGRCNYRLDSRVAVIGNDAIQIPQASTKLISSVTGRMETLQWRQKVKEFLNNSSGSLIRLLDSRSTD